jgi:predicted dehydrogenase
VLSRVLPASPYHRYHNQLDLVGTRGTLAYTSDRPMEVVLGRAGGATEVIRPAGPDVGDAETGSFAELMAVTGYSADRQVADLLATFAGRRPTGVPDLADGHRAQVLLDAVAQAVRTRARVRCADG